MNNIKLKRFKLTIILNNGIQDITFSDFPYKNSKHFYDELTNNRKDNTYLYFFLDDKIIEYNSKDISCIKIEPVKE
ncbi:MAG: hypothetical protein ACRDD7_14550 [Peptostreptococcaceae bacterium]